MTQKESNRKPYPEAYSYHDDEINLADLLLVIWKWKWMIIIGTLIITISSTIVTFQMKKIFDTSIVLQPGILRIGESGKNIYIDSANNIKALIDSGTFNKDILAKNQSYGNVMKSLTFKTHMIKNSDTIKVSYETSDIKLGLDVLSSLSDFITKRYKKLVNYYMNEQEAAIQTQKTKIADAEANIIKYRQDIYRAQKRIEELLSEIKLINENTAVLMKERDIFLSNKLNKDEILSALVYSNTIQQNLELSNNYKNNVADLKSNIDEFKLKMQIADNEKKLLLEEISNLEFKKNQIQNIQVIQPPTNSPYPIKPKKKMIVALSTILGLFLIVFSAFFVEYLRNAMHSKDLASMKK